MFAKRLGIAACLLSLLIQIVVGSDDDAACAADSDESVSDFIANGGFLLLIATVLVSLWALALVCEEYFVPALQVLCGKWNVPDSVAGSLIMAAGNNAV